MKYFYVMLTELYGTKTGCMKFLVLYTLKKQASSLLLPGLKIFLKVRLYFLLKDVFGHCTYLLVNHFSPFYE